MRPPERSGLPLVRSRFVRNIIKSSCKAFEIASFLIKRMWDEEAQLINQNKPTGVTVSTEKLQFDTRQIMGR